MGRDDDGTGRLDHVAVRGMNDAGKYARGRAQWSEREGYGGFCGGRRIRRKGNDLGRDGLKKGRGESVSPESWSGWGCFRGNAMAGKCLSWGRGRCGSVLAVINANIGDAVYGDRAREEHENWLFIGGALAFCSGFSDAI